MAVESTEVRINDNVYTITHFTTTRGMKYLKQITAIIGPSFAMLVGNGEEGHIDLDPDDVSGSMLGIAAQSLVDNMDKENVEQLIKDLLSTTIRNNQAINFDLDFAGSYKELFMLVKEIVMFNYSSVFSGGALDLGALKQAHLA